MDPNTQPPTTPSPTPEPVQPPVQQAPGVSAAPAGPQPATTQENPGKTLGIISLVLPFVGFSLIGLILGIVGLSKSKKAGMSNGFALAGIIVSAITMVIGAIIFAIIILSASSIVQKCQDLGPGTHYENGVTFTCS